MKKKKPTKNDRAYVFNITLNKDNPYFQMQNIKEDVWRNVVILGSQNLYSFAEGIVGAFGFDFDHAFGFFDNLKSWTKSEVKYELFANMPDSREEAPNSISVQKTNIEQVFKSKDDKMLFLFDYGDNWEFIVKLENIIVPDFKKSYPLVTEASGKAPKQYPPLEEDEK